MYIPFIIGLVIFVVFIFFNKQLSEKNYQKLEDEDKVKVIDILTEFKKYNIIPLLFMICGFFAAIKFFPKNSIFILIILSTVILIYLVLISFFYRNKLKKAKIPGFYIKSYIISRTLFIFSLFVLVIIVIFSPPQIKKAALPNKKESLLSKYEHINARSWLNNEKANISLAKDRFSSSEGAKAFIQNLYQLGALEVYLANILDTKEAAEKNTQFNADALIIQIPDNKDKRKKLFSIINKEAENQGFAISRDFGQKEIYLWWKK